MNTNLNSLLIINSLALVLTIAINVFGIGGINGYLACMTFVLIINLLLLIKLKKGRDDRIGKM